MSKVVKEAASRYLLPLEMYMGCISVGIGIAGPLGGGILFKLLQESGQAHTWLLIFVLVGLAQLFVAFFEWEFGRRWSLLKLYQMMRLRSVVAGFAVFEWAVGTIYLWTESRQVIALTIILPINAGFAWWSYHENLKVKYALDGDTPTSTLIFHR